MAESTCVYNVDFRVKINRISVKDLKNACQKKHLKPVYHLLGGDKVASIYAC